VGRAFALRRATDSDRGTLRKSALVDVWHPS